MMYQPELFETLEKIFLSSFFYGNMNQLEREQVENDVSCEPVEASKPFEQLPPPYPMEVRREPMEEREPVEASKSFEQLPPPYPVEIKKEKHGNEDHS